MLIWMIKDGENLPVQVNERKLRTWLLSEELVSRGHSVVWWSSTFSHQKKMLLYDRDVEIDVAPSFKLYLCHAGKYVRNVSLGRYLHHYRLAKCFVKNAKALPKPDIIICSFPLIDLAHKAVLYANDNGVPIIVDVRDLWPDALVEITPSYLKWLVKKTLHNEYRKTMELMRKADALTAVSKGCLKWALSYAKRSITPSDHVYYSGCPQFYAIDHAMSQRIRYLQKVCREKVVFTFVGSFGLSYELGMICDVADMLYKANKRNIHFVLAGDGEQYKKISDRVAELGNVTLLGWIDKFDVFDLLRMSHVGLVACNSVEDAMPNKSAEYLAAGLPILSSLEGEMRNIIREHNVGYSYTASDPARMYDAVIKIASDEPGRRTQSQNAIKLYQSIFDSVNIYRSYADHIEAMGKSGSIHR